MAGRPGARSTSIPSLSRTAVDFVNSPEGYIVGGDISVSPFGALRHTTDGGATWTSEGFINATRILTDVSIVSSNSAPVDVGAHSQSFGGGATTIGGSSFAFSNVTTLGTLVSGPITFDQLSQEAQNDFTSAVNFALAGATTPQLWQTTHILVSSLR